MRLDMGRPAMHQPVSYGVQILADFMALQPVKESFPGSIMIRQVQFLGDKLISPLISGVKRAASYPDSFQFTLKDQVFGFP